MRFIKDLKGKTWRTSFSFLAILMVVASAGCSSKNSSSTSQLHIQFPTVAQTQSAQQKSLASASASGASASLNGFDWSLVCYMVNISASDIASKNVSQCDIPTGVFKGSVAPGGSLTVDVPAGVGRTVDVLVYLRTSTSDSCPVVASGFGPLNRSRIARVGQTTSVDMTNANVTVQVDVSAPLSGVDLVSQYSLASSCRPVVQGSATSRVTLGHSILTGGGMTVVGSVSAQKSEAILTGGGLTMHLTRQTN